MGILPFRANSHPDRVAQLSASQHAAFGAAGHHEFLDVLGIAEARRMNSDRPALRLLAHELIGTDAIARSHRRAHRIRWAPRRPGATPHAAPARPHPRLRTA
jgi:hypothetical protein